MLTIIHIDTLAKDLNVERRWIIDNWVNRSDAADAAGPAPCFRDGHNWFFEAEELKQWAKRRSHGSDCTSTETGPMD